MSLRNVRDSRSVKPAAALYLRSRSGQSAILIALSLFTMVIFVAFVTNIGILVNDKIRVQSAADLGAFSAAYREAQVMNRLAAVNYDILKEAERCRVMLEGGEPWMPPSCDCQPIHPIAEQIISSCSASMDAMAAEFQATASYSASVSNAIAAGQYTMNENVSGISGEFFEGYSGSATAPGAYSVDGVVAAIADFSRLTTNFNYWVSPLCPCFTGCCYMPTVPSPIVSASSYYVKDDRDPDVWVMAEASGTMSGTYLDIAYSPGGNDGGYFGGSSDGGESDRMVALSVAKPFDGSVGPTVIYLGDGSTSGIAAGNYGLPVERSIAFMLPEAYIQPTYRARLAGVHEWDGSSTIRTPVATIAQAYGIDYANLIRH
jgi:hypothetical protein